MLFYEIQKDFKEKVAVERVKNNAHIGYSERKKLGRIKHKARKSF